MVLFHPHQSPQGMAPTSTRTALVQPASTAAQTRMLKMQRSAPLLAVPPLPP